MQVGILNLLPQTTVAVVGGEPSGTLTAVCASNTVKRGDSVFCQIDAGVRPHLSILLSMMTLLQIFTSSGVFSLSAPSIVGSLSALTPELGTSFGFTFTARSGADMRATPRVLVLLRR